MIAAAPVIRSGYAQGTGGDGGAVVLLAVENTLPPGGPMQAAAGAYYALQEANEPPQIDGWDIVGARDIRRRPLDSEAGSYDPWADV